MANGGEHYWTHEVLCEKVHEMEMMLKGDGSEDNPGIGRALYENIKWQKTRDEERKIYEGRQQWRVMAIIALLMALLGWLGLERVNGHHSFFSLDTPTTLSAQSQQNSQARW